MHLHILGICGTFMGGIAAIARRAGHTVTGCDANVYPPMSTQLGALGIALTEGYDAAQLDGVAKTADVFVVGNVVSRGNPLMEAVMNANRAYVSGPQWLYENVLRDRFVLAVAGTHGKTTTSAMLAHILEQAGLAPSFLIGGVAVDFGISARLTDSAFFVIEADEYDTAFFDKRSKFVHYRPRAAILNNLEFDHADIFADLGAIETQFHHFVRTIPGDGCIVANGGDDALARVLARGAWSAVERFDEAPSQATPPAEWTIAGDGRVAFCGEPTGTLDFDQPGRHNRLNALAAIAAARRAGAMPQQALAALRAFRGVRRRMELRGEVGGVAVYDDFAHHPTAIATTIEGLRMREPNARVLAVLEPRSNTMKLGAMKAALPASLAHADRVYCFAANLGWDAQAALAPLGSRAEVHDDLAALVTAVVRDAQPGDRVLVMSNGGFGGVHGRLLDALRARVAA
ncbi:MAG TPA: UDP-N-acetylmuramate:L-alanyl-gamma-D-glutamyl-meso-diaminopimelate ligase [Casimicrobiaceae bacterium]|nr:UDP-N-acetylmuramate:L-alanyl-gamma-D-glutamyl-meso-diaminopimelate ligase [Casimicrobiaceae bacterium]